jgi:O-antigen biosynthesis protein
MSPRAVEPGLVSVITPCHNGQRFVADAIRSVIAQTYSPVEHIVVDDASRDGSWEVIRSFGDQVRGVRLERNMGGSHARNAGFDLARGEFVMFLDADDTLAEDTLAALVEALSAGGDVAACQWRRLLLTAAGWRQKYPDPPPPRAGDDHLRRWLEGGWIPPCAVLWRRQAYESTGGWDEELLANQDGDLMLRAFAGGLRLVGARGGRAFYRDHGSVAGTVGSDLTDVRKLRSRMRALEKLTATLESGGTLKHYRRPLGIAYHRLALLGLSASPELSRVCLERGRMYAGPVDVSRTLPGRILGRMVGMERKEQIAFWLARLGIGTGARRRMLERAEFRKSMGFDD